MTKNSPRSYIGLSKKNLVSNLLALKSVAKKGTTISIAIKGNAYGHGQNKISKILEPFVGYFQVDSVSELELLRSSSKKKAFLFGYVQKSDLQKAIRLGCILSVFSLEELRAIEQIARKFKTIQEVHVPVDAYLGREGFLPSKLSDFFKALKMCKNVKLTGIYAHFANIEDTNNFTHAKRQIDEYTRAIQIAEGFGFKNLQTHISATSGLLVYEKGSGINPIVRLGVGVYGLWPSQHIEFQYKNKLKLSPVLSWKTKIAQVKTLPAGHTVGYGLAHRVFKSTKIAVVPIGYADGYDRGLSNKGEVLIGGKKCKILGRVAMNMFVVDVNKVKGVKTEDEVVLIGRQGKQEITAEEMAEKIETINYEVVTRISALTPRLII